MSELIKREDAIKATWHDPSYIDPYNILTEARDRIEALPTVDAVPVVRCKECRFFKPWDNSDYGKCKTGLSVMGDMFCSCGSRADGERRTE